MSAPPAAFLAQAADLGVEFEAGDLDRLGEYLTRLLETNRQFNLTAVTDPEAAWERHILDSLTLMPFLVTAEAKRVVDVGSGGGLPGLPLAIVMPGISFTLLEATGKKARFLSETAAALGLANVAVLPERAETVGRPGQPLREHFDMAIARAVGRLNVLLELALPLVRPGGWVAVIKGQRAGEEIREAARALRLLHGQIAGTTRTPTGTIILVQKTEPTAKRYPRRPGEPAREPL